MTRQLNPLWAMLKNNKTAQNNMIRKSFDRIYGQDGYYCPCIDERWRAIVQGDVTSIIGRCPPDVEQGSKQSNKKKRP